MHRIDDPTAVAIKPTPRPQGVPGFFTRGEPGVQNPTIVRYEFLNTVQGEIEHVITQAGIVLNKLDDTQLFQAITALMAAAVDDPPDDGYSYTRVHNRWVSGGVIRSDVTFAANLTVGGSLSIGLGGSPFYMVRSGGYQNVMHAAESYDQYVEATGDRVWVGNIGAGAQYLMTLTAGNLWNAGNFSCGGAVTANGITSNLDLTAARNLGVTGTAYIGGLFTTGGSATVNGQLEVAGNALIRAATYPAYNLAADWNIGVSGQWRLIQWAAGWWYGWDSSNGNINWQSPSATLMTLNGAGDLSVSRAIYSGANIQGYAVFGTLGVFATLDQQLGMTGYPDGRRDISFGGNGNTWTWTSGNVTWFGTGGGNSGGLWSQEIWSLFCQNHMGPVGGHGFVDASDARGKSNVVPSRYGLAEVLQLQPVSFIRTGPNQPRDQRTGQPLPPRTEIGFVAQDVQPIIPEAVVMMPRVEGRDVVLDDKGMLGITDAAILAAVVNAIKEMDTRVRAVEAKQ